MKMKRLLFSLVALALTSICFAQDVLVKKDGSTILAKILRITETDVVYKNYDNPDGPTRLISISSLLRINYQNGQTETFSAAFDDIVTKETATKFSDDQKLMQMYFGSDRTKKMLMRAERLKFTGWVAGGALVVTGLIVAATAKIKDHHTYHIRHVVPGVTMICVGAPIWASCCLRAKKIEEDYKYSVQTSPVFQQEFNVGKNECLMVGVDILNDNTMKHQTVGMGLRYNF